MSLSRRQFLASLAGVFALAGTSSAAHRPVGTYALAGRIFTGRKDRPVTGCAVLIRDGLIENVVPDRAVTDRPVLRYPDATIMPGVINAHCHRIHTPEDRRDRWLSHGVTAVGDPGSCLADMKHLARSPTGTTATAAFSGPVLAAPGGYPLPVHSPEYALVIRSPQEAEDAVKMLADRGATMIKLAFEPGVMPVPWPGLDPRTAGAACDAARRLGLIVRCHVQDLSGLEPALDAGVHTIEHVPHRWIGNNGPQSVIDDDGTVTRHYRKLLERMVRDDVILTPTLDVLSRSPWDGPALYEPVGTFCKLGGPSGRGQRFPLPADRGGHGPAGTPPARPRGPGTPGHTPGGHQRFGGGVRIRGPGRRRSGIPCRPAGGARRPGIRHGRAGRPASRHKGRSLRSIT